MSHPQSSTRGSGRDARTSLVDQLARAARMIADERDLDATIARTTDYAVQLVDGCDAAGIALVSARASVVTAASTDDLVAGADRMQHELGEGPNLEPRREIDLVRVPDLARDERWPRWSAWVSERLGMRSLLSIQLLTSSTRHGHLNLYSREVGAFDEETHPTATMLATVAVMALSSAATEENLHSAIRSRNVIGQAQGIIMERYNVSAEHAFAVLSRVSQESNVKLHDVALEIATHRVVPGVGGLESVDGAAAEPAR